MKLLIQLVREILHLSGKSQGKVREFQTPMAVATMDKVTVIAELAERSPIIIQKSSNPSSRKTLDVRPYDRPYKVLLLACAANCTTGTILLSVLYTDTEKLRMKIH